MDAVVEVALRHRLRRIELDVSLDAGRETIGLVGPSGAGKSSVLRAVAGLLRPAEGRIRVEGQTWFDGAAGLHLPPERRSAGLVFQDQALFPHLTVAGNVAYAVRDHGGRRERRERVAGVLGTFGIEGLAESKPGSISGGERQRVALARAVASDPRVLLLDEPLTGLDPATKSGVATELSRHLRELSLPAVLVSHDFGDVVGLADRVAVMEAGRIVQVGSAAELLQAPATPFVAALTGVNYFVGTAARHGDVTEIETESGAAFLSADEAAGPVGVVIYPWDVGLSTVRQEGSARNSLRGPVTRVAGVGNRIRVTVASRPSIVAEVTDESIHRLGIGPGVEVVASWKATGTRLIPRLGATEPGV